VIAAIGLGSLPLVFATQYVGGAAPQWGGRYILTSAVLLGAIGIARLDDLQEVARKTLVTSTILVTLFGLCWLSVRSHQVDHTFDALSQRDEPVIVSTLYHLAREGGTRTEDQHWLTVYHDGDRAFAAQIVADAGYDRFALVTVHHDDDDPLAEPPLDGFVPVHTDEIPFIEPVHLDVTTYERAGG
jgi:hypothetical protein